MIPTLIWALALTAALGLLYPLLLAMPYLGGGDR